MLVLGRKVDQEVRQTASNGEVVVVKVLAIRGNQVQLGFEANKSVEITREELFEKPEKAA